MGLENAEVTLCNPRKPDLAPVKVAALADTGSLHLCIPEHVRIQLELEEIDKKEATLADDSRRLLPYVGPIEIRFGNRVGFVGALVLSNQVSARSHPHGRHGSRGGPQYTDVGGQSEQSEHRNVRREIEDQKVPGSSAPVI